MNIINLDCKGKNKEYILSFIQYTVDTLEEPTEIRISNCNCVSKDDLLDISLTLNEQIRDMKARTMFFGYVTDIKEIQYKCLNKILDKINISYYDYCK